MTQRERRGRDPGRLFTVFYRLFTLFLTAHAEDDRGIGLIALEPAYARTGRVWQARSAEDGVITWEPDDTGLGPQPEPRFAGAVRFSRTRTTDSWLARVPRSA
jgi:hypothetical protein